MSETATNSDVPPVRVLGVVMPSSGDKRSDECLFCTKRKCHERVVSTDGGWTYDEVACMDHVIMLHHHSDKAAPGVRKHFISSTGNQKRGVPFKS